MLPVRPCGGSVVVWKWWFSGLNGFLNSMVDVKLWILVKFNRSGLFF